MYEVALAGLVRRWRQSAAHASPWLARTHRLLADELENELVLDTVSAAVAVRLAREWERHAEQLRDSKSAFDHVPTRLRAALTDPTPVEAADDNAQIFQEAAAQLRRVVRRRRMTTAL